MPNIVSNVDLGELQPTTVAIRGYVKTFEFGFFSDDARTQPITPIDPNTYPRVVVYDSDGEIVTTSQPPHVRPSENVGYWKYEFTVPESATLTADNSFWIMAAEIESSNGRYERVAVQFAIKSPEVVKNLQTRLVVNVLAQKGFRIQYVSAVELASITLSITEGTSEDSYVVRAAVPGSSDGSIIHTIQGDKHVYHYDVRWTQTPGVTLRSLQSGMHYIALWDTTEAPGEFPETTFQIVKIRPRSWLMFVPDVSITVDKLGKRASSVFAIDEDQIFEGLEMGMQFVNSIMPSTSWTVEQVASNDLAVLKPYIALAAGYWIFMGQLGAAVDLQFNFSGATTTLDQDLTGGIGDLLERFRSALWENLKESKTDIYRHQNKIGVVATRPKSARHMYTTVFKVSNLPSNNVIAFLNSIGLI